MLNREEIERLRRDFDADQSGAAWCHALLFALFVAVATGILAVL